MSEGTPSGTVSSNRGIMIVLSYLWLLALVPLLTEKEDAEVQWHAKHGIVLMVAEIIVGVVLSILLSIPVLGCVLAILPVIWFAVVVIVHIVAMVKGVNGQRLIIPHVSEYTSKF